MSTREELRDTFRVENPEITIRAITDVQLHSFMKSANKQICAMTRCIQSNESEVFNSVADTQFYDLEDQIDNFYAIDDMPGGGVYYDDMPLILSSAGQMNSVKKSWKSNASSTPKRYWTRGKYLWFDCPPVSVAEIAVDCILKPDPFDADNKMPFNEIGSLQVFDEGIIKYCQWRSKQKLGKYDEARVAKDDYLDYVKWMKHQVVSTKMATISIRPAR